MSTLKRIEARLETSATETGAEDQMIKQIIASPDAKDTVTVDVPLLIRLLEHAREDVKDDAQLHVFVEGILDQSKQNAILTMQQWPAIIA